MLLNFRALPLAAIALGAVSVAMVTLIPAAEARPRNPNNSLVIVDADRGQVVYDDGRDDGACIMRRVFAGYDYYGYPIFRKRMRCF